MNGIYMQREYIHLILATYLTGVKWVYRIKLNDLGEIKKYEERFVVKGYAEEHVIDYNELLAHVERMYTLRLIIAFAGQRGLKLYKLDVK